MTCVVVYHRVTLMWLWYASSTATGFIDARPDTQIPRPGTITSGRAPQTMGFFRDVSSASWPGHPGPGEYAFYLGENTWNGWLLGDKWGMSMLDMSTIASPCPTGPVSLADLFSTLIWWKFSLVIFLWAFFRPWFLCFLYLSFVSIFSFIF